MSCPVFCITTGEDTEPTLDLVNASGCGNAIPTRSTFRDLDHRYNYSTGDVGKVPIRQQHELILSMDEVPRNIRQQLLDWKFKRMPVTLCQDSPGWPITDDTKLLIVPSNRTSFEIFTDLTGRYSLRGAFASKKFIWDEREKYLTGRDVDQLITEDTPHGKGWRFHGGAVNLGSPSSPEGVTSGYGSGDAGWVISPGAEVAVSLDTTNFPAPAPYKNSLRFVSTTGDAATLYLLSSQLDPASDAAGYFRCSIFVKGLMGQSARLDLFVDSVLDNSLDLSGENFLDWTLITVEAYRADWTNLEPQVELHFNEGVEDTVDFYVGPHNATFIQAGGEGLNPHWCFDNSALLPTVGEVHSFDNAPETTEGLMTLDFVIPEDADLENKDDIYLGLADFGGGSSAGRLTLTKASGVSIVFLSVTHPAGSASFLLESKHLAAGRHIYSVSYDTVADTMTVIIDGVLLEERSVVLATFAGGDLFYLGNAGTYTNPLFYFLAMRLDSVAPSTAEIIGHHQSALNEVARGTRELAQGRYYEIISVPQTPLIQEGNSLWVGDLVLRQVSYTAGASTWYAKEAEV